MKRPPPPLLVMAPLSAATCSLLFVPREVVGELFYVVIALLCVGAGMWGVLRHGRSRAPGSLLVLTGFLAWALGDVVFFIEQHAFGLEAYPAPSDAVYVGGYALMAMGLVVMVRRRGSHADLAAVLDAAILATGTAVVAGVFVIAPIAGDSSLTMLGKFTSTFYPVADILLLGILARLWTTPGSRTGAFRLLAGSLGLTLFADVLYNGTSIVTGDVSSWLINDILWLGSYVLVAGAAWSSTVTELSARHHQREDQTDPSRRFVVLTGGLLLPALALIVDGLTPGPVAWPVTAAGSVILCVLVLTRMAGLLKIVRAQAVQLSALARSDPLTGVPNRRTWDYELLRACQVARDTHTPLTVALLDLDNFKAYNDTYGHPAGDRLLKEATARWNETLEDGEVLARYGGEEFAILFPGRTAAEAKDRVLGLMGLTPKGQTFSAGVATWIPSTEPSAALAAADVALYNAKRAGRHRVNVSLEASTGLRFTSPSIVFQPIVDLTTRIPIAVEALSQFIDGDPLSVFDTARRHGRGAELEAAAIAAARELHTSDLKLSINVSLDALTAGPVRDALQGDLTEIILEITEHTDIEPDDDLMSTVQEYRDRGVTIAVDDWGRGFSNLDRLLLLRPEIVKVDMSLVHNLDLDYHRAAVQTVTMWAELVGARICAEGIETEDQWYQLQRLGVHLGQGWFFGRPAPLVADATVTASTSQPVSST